MISGVQPLNSSEPAASGTEEHEGALPRGVSESQGVTYSVPSLIGMKELIAGDEKQGGT